MRISVNEGVATYRHTTQVLKQRMLGAVCGLDQRIGFMARSRFEPRVMVAGAELTGVHVLRGRERPKQGAYHIGGSGLLREESLICSLGETAERYAQLITGQSQRFPVTFATHEEMSQRGERVLPAERLAFFTPEQLARPGFPFQAFSPTQPIGWVRVRTWGNSEPLWVPAQFLLLGYQVRKELGEPWMLSAVTTGTATHSHRGRALRAALLELLQIDSAMGHWYSARTAPRVVMDARTKAVSTLVRRHTSERGPQPTFHWLPNADSGAMSIACVLRGAPGSTPAAAVGLGVDLRLERAMYKSFLEATGVWQLAKINLFVDGALARHTREEARSAPIFNLDDNVGFYAMPGHGGELERKFDARDTVRASELPPDFDGDLEAQLQVLLQGFTSTGKTLAVMDLTPVDIRELGLHVVRVWSPDTLSLSLPSAPAARHARFKAYGGFAHERPHPYP